MPTPEAFRAAARGALGALGVSERHYGVLTIHQDTKHRHAHVVFSRIDPATGLAATLKHSGPVLSKWAREWEREHGGIVVQARDHDRQPAPRKVRDAIGRLHVRTPDERREWRELLQRQREEQTPPRDARRERAGLNRNPDGSRPTPAPSDRSTGCSSQKRQARPPGLSPTPQNRCSTPVRVDVSEPPSQTNPDLVVESPFFRIGGRDRLVRRPVVAERRGRGVPVPAVPHRRRQGERRSGGSGCSRQPMVGKSRFRSGSEFGTGNHDRLGFQVRHRTEMQRSRTRENPRPLNQEPGVSPFHGGVILSRSRHADGWPRPAAHLTVDTR